MKTGQDVVEHGLYVSRCCGHEQTFEKQGSFQRCRACDSLCEWELAETVEIPVNHKKAKRDAA